MPQGFATADRLRLEVRNDPPPGSFRDYIVNGDGVLGGYGWLSPVENTLAGRGSDGGTLMLRTVTAQSGVYFTTEAIPYRTGATHLRYSFSRAYGGATIGVKGRVDFYDAAGALLSSTASSTLLVADSATASSDHAIPAGTVTLKVRFDLTRAGAAALNALDSVHLRGVHLVQATAADLSGTVALEDGWTDILGDAGELEVDRSELNLGLLTATLYSPELDPATADTIRKGKAFRVHVDLPEDSTNLEPLLAGEILNAEVDYDLLHPDPNKRTIIKLSGVDPAKALSAAPRADGVAEVAELAAVLEGAGVPWNLNGDTGHTPTTPPVVARNANATAIDQIAVTRDSALGYAWVDRHGVANAWDALELAGRDPYDGTLDETVYADLTVDYDTDRCINVVRLKYLRLDPVTGETEEVDYGPYVDLASREEWGPHEATFTVQGLAEEPAGLQSYADAILAANAVPRRRVTSAKLHLRTVADLLAWSRLDLYDLVRVVNARAGIDEDLLVVGVHHAITAGAGDSLWTLEVKFTGEGGVAPPQEVPSPPATAAKTLAQLLRPVGEVTVMHGLPSQVWPGWLVLNGAALTAGEYPELEEWLTAAGLPTNVLPDYTDRVVVGAGIKALGAKTGTWAKTILATMLPAHRHGLPRSAGTGSGASIPRGGPADGTTTQTDNSTAPTQDLDVTPPVIAAYWVIRARSGV